MSDRPVVLVCPLDWGLGHATRCVPVIRKFSEKGYQVVIAADGRPLEFLKREFPNCRSIRFPGIRISYSATRSFALRMAFFTPALLIRILQEHHQMKKIIRKENPSVIFSDNRYGLWNRSVHTIFMTHQLRVIPPGVFRILSGIINSLLRYFIGKFDECWVPDLEGHLNLAGELSHPLNLPPKVRYLGPLSRFDPTKRTDVAPSVDTSDFLVIISGPEPQRSLFENLIIQTVKNSGLTGTIVRGIPEETGEWDLNGNIHIYSHLETQRLSELVLNSGIVICRPGYSGIMDLVVLGKRAIFVPTPGQTEQEYLAKYLMEKKYFFSLQQEKFDLIYALEMSNNFPGLVIENNLLKLEEAINSIPVRNPDPGQDQ
jgi:uncharacterized protein (TIGR00661 family)